MNCRLGGIAVIVFPALGLPSDANIGRFVKIDYSYGICWYKDFNSALFAWRVVGLGGPLVSVIGMPLLVSDCPDLFLSPIRGETQTEMMLDAAHV